MMDEAENPEAKRSNLLCHKDLLKFSPLPGKPIRVLDPNTGELFEGTAYSTMDTAWGLLSITYVQYRNGVQEGLRVNVLEDGRVLNRMVMKNTLLHGKNESFYLTGLPRSLLTFRIADCRKSNLYEIKVWKPNGLRCPHSGMDDEGDGVRYHYNEDGIVDGISFFEKHRIRNEIYYHKGRFSAAWVYQEYPDHKEWSVV